VGVTSLKQFPPKPEGCPIDVYASEKEITKPFTVACVLDSSTGSTLFDDRTGAAAINQTKAEACKCGADAIVITSVGQTGVSYGGWGQGMAVIKAIKFTGN
jgi:hypothetical protein